MTNLAPTNTAALPALSDGLPESNVTTLLLQSLDYVVPGQWRNLRGFEATLREVTGVTDPASVAAIRERALQLYADPNQGFSRAVSIYQLVDKADVALGAAALANKIGDRLPLLSFISRLTPKADTTQAIDLAVKLAAEAIAFSHLKGLRHENVNAFTQALAEYSGASAMRLAALVCVDGLIPLGPDFVQAVGGMLGRVRPGDLANNPVFNRVGGLIPGGSTGAQLGFLQETVNASGAWLNNFVGQRGLTRQGVIDRIGQFVALSDDVLDYLGAFLDATTDYMTHTGIQTVSRLVIERAAQVN